MSETSSPKVITGRDLLRLDRAREAFKHSVTGPDWLRDFAIQAVEIADGDRVYRYTRLDDDRDGGLVETLISGDGEAR